MFKKKMSAKLKNKLKYLKGKASISIKNVYKLCHKQILKIIGKVKFFHQQI